ncbi:MAG: alpha/beta fold hydrolase [Candidatus Krumholzibacteriia bacterium]
MKRRFDLPEDLYPFKSHWHEVDGLPVHYIDEGQGEPLLFFHGNPTWSLLYRDIVKGLRDRYRCIAVDYPGMGLSGKPREHGHPEYGFTPAEHSRAIQDLVEALDLRDLTVMVQDWGGPIGLGVATRASERIARVVIGNTWAWPMNDWKVWMFSNGLGKGIGRQLILRRNLFVEKLLPAGVNRRERLTPEVMAAYRGPYPTAIDREPTAVFPREILGSIDYLEEVEGGLGKLADKPIQIVWGNKDAVFGKRELNRWKEIFPRARARILDGANHFIQEDAPEAIVEELNAFLST